MSNYAADTALPTRYVVTGGPTVGKQAVFNALRNTGIPCTDGEPAREIYRAFKERLGRHLQAGDRREYSAEVLKNFIEEFCAHKRGMRFYNRGIPDGFGWDRFFGLGPSVELQEASRVYRYDGVFVLDPLDTFEDESGDVWAKDRELQRVHQLIVQGYYDAGYTPIFVPADDANARLKFILANLPGRLA
jgi:predicted ATPase